MAASLEGKVAIVTGATSGIGRATAERLVAEGAHVVLAGRRAELGESVARALGPQARFVAADVVEEADIARLVATTHDHYGTVDILFNNAGAPGPGGSITAIEAASFDRAVAVLLRSVLLGIKHVAPVMIAAGRGAIISNASVAGHLGGYATSHVYSALKAAVIQLSRSCALELAEHGVRVNTVSPGAIATGVFGHGAGLDADAADATAPLVEKLLRQAQPLGRTGLPADVAAAVAFLASDDAGFITGRDLVIDGGLIAGRRYREVEASRLALRKALRPDEA